MNELMQAELDEWKNEREERQNEQIQDLESANWYFRKLRAVQEQLNQNIMSMQAEINRIETWYAPKNESLKKDLFYFESMLKRYYQAEREKNPKFKLATPHGKVSSRKNDDWKCDKAIAIASLKEMGLKDLVRTKEELDKEALRLAKKEGKLILSEDGQLLTTDGEIIEGIKVTKVESISVKAEL